MLGLTWGPGAASLSRLLYNSNSPRSRLARRKPKKNEEDQELRSRFWLKPLSVHAFSTLSAKLLLSMSCSPQSTSCSAHHVVDDHHKVLIRQQLPTCPLQYRVALNKFVTQGGNNLAVRWHRHFDTCIADLIDCERQKGFFSEFAPSGQWAGRRKLCSYYGSLRCYDGGLGRDPGNWAYASVIRHALYCGMPVPAHQFETVKEMGDEKLGDIFEAILCMSCPGHPWRPHALDYAVTITMCVEAFEACHQWSLEVFGRHTYWWPSSKDSRVESKQCFGNSVGRLHFDSFCRNGETKT